ncbi:MAG TPA: Maf family nucleotide pyrophosphatase [Bacteroidia bacterium]|nr:Maf family nucleotide pyrophosphatase [Bacteroidia bacterium]
MLPENFHVILASKSPRRQFLLHGIGIDFEQKTMEVDESFPDHLHDEEIPLYLCRKKAEAFQHVLGEKTLIITADTIVWINGHVLNKPADEEEARIMLRELSGNRHEVYTGVCLKTQKKEVSFSVRTDVLFNELSEEEITFYIRAYKPFDKAGSYGAQECLPPGMNPCSGEEIAFLDRIGKSRLAVPPVSPGVKQRSIHAIRKIEGSYFNVMGLPVMELYGELEAF